MRIFLAWHNLMEKKLQAIVAVGGVTFAVFLMFMQMGIQAAVGKNATLLHDAFAFDIALLSPRYQRLTQADWIARGRLKQAGMVEGVAAVVPLHAAIASYRNPVNGLPIEVATLGVDPEYRPFVSETLNQQVLMLHEEDTALIDTESRPQVGPMQTGLHAELDRRRLRTVGVYRLGSGFLGDGSLIVSDLTFVRSLEGRSLDKPSVGLVRLVPGTDRDAAVERLRAALGPEVMVLARPDMEKIDQDFFVKVKPIGIMFSVGVWLSFVVGAVTLYQVLSAEAGNRRIEYATLKAIGYTDGYLNRLVLQQAALMIGIGLAPAFLLALGFYWLLRETAKVPASMTANRLGLVIVLTAVMGALATALVLRKLRTADPADLF